MAKSRGSRSSRKFRVLVGCSYPPNSNVVREPGEIVDDVPARIAATWVNEKVLEPVKEDD